MLKTERLRKTRHATVWMNVQPANSAPTTEDSKAVEMAVCASFTEAMMIALDYPAWWTVVIMHYSGDAGEFGPCTYWLRRSEFDPHTTGWDNMKSQFLWVASTKGVV